MQAKRIGVRYRPLEGTMAGHISLLALTPPLPSARSLVGPVLVALLAALFIAWNAPIPRWMFATKVALGAASVAAGSLAYAAVWLIPIYHVQPLALAMTVFAVVNLGALVWLRAVAWDYGSFVRAALMFSLCLNFSLLAIGVSSRVTFAAIFAPGMLLTFGLVFRAAWIFPSVRGQRNLRGCGQRKSALSQLI